MRASYAFVLQKNNVEVSTYSVLTPTFIIEPVKRTAPTTTVIGAGKDLQGTHTPTFAKESFYIIQLYTATVRLHVHV